MKIKSLEIRGLRGVRKDLSIILNTPKSVLIYGDNGSGKSSITDALEWFYYDKVEHLSTEEIGTKGLNGLRNVFLDDQEDAHIDLKYTDPKCDSRKRIFIKRGKLTTEHSNGTKDFNNYLSKSLKENLILRYNDLLKFILSSKTEKLKEISQIIGFSEVTRVKDVLIKSVNDLKKELKIQDFDRHISTKQGQILEQIRQMITNDDQYFSAVKELILPLKLTVEIKDEASVNSVLELIKKPENKDAILQQASYEKAIENLNGLKESFANSYSSYESFYNKSQQIVTDKEKFKKISLEKLLSEGLSALEKRVLETDKCPLCLQEKNREELIDELRKRIEELAIFKKDKEVVLDEKDTVQRLIQLNLSETEAILRENCLLLEENSEIKITVENLREIFSNALDEIKKISVLEADQIGKPEEFIRFDIAAIQRTVSALTAKKEKIIIEKKDDSSFSVYTKIFSVRQAYNEIKSLKKASDVLKQQQRSLEFIYDEFVKKQREGLCSFLESISKDINDFYLFMNDSENVSGIELIPLDIADEFIGLTIQFKFHGKTDSPPHKYLSESHLNCLGICLFLASIKAFNKINNIFILDDVISSYDKGHRGKFARLLTERFSDYQIFLFTHEEDWFELFSKMVKGKNWEIKKIQWDSENGPVLEMPLLDLKERIEAKFKKSDSSELGNMIRKYLERLLKDICHDCEVRVKFLFNDQNENRMSNELLSELKSKLKDRKCEIKDEPIFDRLSGSVFIGNRTSHDSSFSESIGDLKMFYSDVLELEKLFRCNQCGKLISKKYCDSTEDKIKCYCGNLKYNLKK